MSEKTSRPKRPTIYETLPSRYKVLPNGCWEWTGWRSNQGYGYGYANGKTLAVTHVALELDGRPKPFPDAHALHSCDNPPCINPAHLRWGTNAENIADKFARGRHLKSHCINGHEFTEENTRVYNGFRRCYICLRAAGRRSEAKKAIKRKNRQ